MATFTKAPTGPSLRVEHDRIDVSTWGPERDPTWRYVDKAGHGHFHDNGYPTLTEITEPMTDPDTGDEWQAHVRWECPHCGEHITPATRPTMDNQSAPGAKRYFVDDQEVDRDTFIEAWRPLVLAEVEQREADL